MAATVQTVNQGLPSGARKALVTAEGLTEIIYTGPTVLRGIIIDQGAGSGATLVVYDGLTNVNPVYSWVTADGEIRLEDLDIPMATGIYITTGGTTPPTVLIFD